MATTIVTKNGSGAPTASDLVAGELAVDLTNKRLYTEDSGGTVLELGTNPASDVTFGDNTKAIFGAGSDLQIYHDASDSIINDNGTGSLKLQQGGSTKLEVTATGIDVTGTVTADGLTVDVTDKIDFGGGAGEYASSPVAGVVGFTSRGSVALFTDSNNNGSLTGSAFTIYDGAEYGGATKTLLEITKGNDISFYEDTGTTPKLFWDASQENLAIGGSAVVSDAKLQLSGAQGSTQSIMFTGFGTDKDAAISHNNGNIIFSNGGNNTTVANLTERMRIDASGNVGIGLSSNIDRKLHIEKDDEYAAKFGGTAGGFDFAIEIGQSSASGSPGFNATAGSMKFSMAGTEAMRIDSSGQVGIGTSSPAYLMHLEDSNGAELALGNSTVSPSAGDYLGRIYALDSGDNFFAGINMFYHDENDGEIRFRVKTDGTNANVMTLVDGNVGIGIAPDSNSKLHVQDDTSSLDDYTIHIESYTPAVVFHDISATSTDFAIQADGSALMFRYGDASTGTQLASEAMRIDSSGHAIIPAGVTLGTAVGTYNADNTLDDYEEGAWTPSVNSGSISGTSITYTGKYVKVGDMVTYTFKASNVTGDIQVSSYVTFDGLPFALSNDATSTVMTEDFDVFSRQGFASAGGTVLNLSACGSSSGTTDLSVSITCKISA